MFALSPLKRCGTGLRGLQFPVASVAVAHFRHFSGSGSGPDALQALSHAEDVRIQAAKQRYMQQWQGSGNIIAERNHHYNRSLNGLEGPNALGVHLSYAARTKFRRGTHGKWGLSRRSIGRFRDIRNNVTSP
eukprot:symbB.v1.2.012366.t1/scaffold839.1/size158637/5